MTSDEQQRMAKSVEELSARIARLAIGLRVSLKTDDEVARAMHHPTTLPMAHERRATTERRGGLRSVSMADRRQSHLHDELRGLLVMRYDIETRYVEAVGVVATRQILVEAEAHLARDGFQPGASGVDLDRLFKES
jgi:hypothetical protein